MQLNFDISSFGRTFLDLRSYHNQSPARLLRVLDAAFKRFPNCTRRVDGPYVCIDAPNGCTLLMIKPSKGKKA